MCRPHIHQQVSTIAETEGRIKTLTYMYRMEFFYFTEHTPQLKSLKCTTLKIKLDSRLLCNTRGASRLANKYYILIRALELTLQGQM